MPTAARSFSIEAPKPNGGPRLYLHNNGRMTVSYDNPRMALDAQPATRPVRIGRDELSVNGGGPDQASQDPMGDLVKMLRGRVAPEDHTVLISLLRQIASDPDSVPGRLDDGAEDEENAVSIADPTGSINPADYSSRNQPRIAGDAALRQRRARDAVAASVRIAEVFPDFNRLKHSL